MNSIYAFLALMTVMTLSVNQQRGVHESRMTMMKSEVFVVATGVANEQFERLAEFPFDSLQTQHGLTRDVLIPFEADTFRYEVHTNVTYASYDGSTFKVESDTTDFQEVILTITGELDAQITTARIYNRAGS